MKELKFKRALGIVKGKEGKFSNHKYDTGGKTMFGITKTTAIRHGYFGRMKNLTYERAAQILKRGYWDKYKLDLIDDFFL